MNLLEIEDKLKNLSDLQLHYEMINGIVPGYLALAEFQRRRDAKLQEIAQQKQAPPLSETIPVQVMQMRQTQNPATLGIPAAAPFAVPLTGGSPVQQAVLQPAEQQAQPQSYVSGGLTKHNYAPGGIVAFRGGGDSSGRTGFAAASWEDVWNFPGLLNMPTASAAELGDNVQGPSSVPTPASPVTALAPAMPPTAEGMAAFSASPEQRPVQPPPEDPRAFAEFKRQMLGGQQVSAGTLASYLNGPNPRIQSAPASQREEEALNRYMDLPNQSAIRQQEIVKNMPALREKLLTSIKAEMGDPLAKTAQELDRLIGESKTSGEDAKNQALLQMGLGMMGTSVRTRGFQGMLEAAGQSGEKALLEYNKYKELQKDRELKLLGVQTTLAMAQDARSRGMIEHADALTSQATDRQLGIEQNQTKLIGQGVAALAEKYARDVGYAYKDAQLSIEKAKVVAEFAAANKPNETQTKVNYAIKISPTIADAMRNVKDVLYGPVEERAWSHAQSIGSQYVAENKDKIFDPVVLEAGRQKAIRDAYADWMRNHSAGTVSTGLPLTQSGGKLLYTGKNGYPISGGSNTIGTQ